MVGIGKAADKDSSLGRRGTPAAMAADYPEVTPPLQARERGPRVAPIDGRRLHRHEGADRVRREHDLLPRPAELGAASVPDTHATTCRGTPNHAAPHRRYTYSIHPCNRSTKIPAASACLRPSALTEPPLPQAHTKPARMPLRRRHEFLRHDIHTQLFTHAHHAFYSHSLHHRCAHAQRAPRQYESCAN